MGGSVSITVARTYGLSDWSAPIQSVMLHDYSGITPMVYLSEFPFAISIGQYVFYLFIFRMAVSFATMSVILLLSSLSPTTSMSMVRASLILLLLPLLYGAGLSGTLLCMASTLLSGNLILAAKPIPTLVLGIWIVFVGILALRSARRFFI